MHSPLYIIVRFALKEGEIDQLVSLIKNFFSEEVSQFPGFKSAKLHRNEDGTVLINYATWESAEHFQQFIAFARDSERSKQIQVYKPTQDRVYEVWL